MGRTLRRAAREKDEWGEVARCVICQLPQIKRGGHLALLEVQDELDNGLRALAGLRHLMSAHDDPDNSGVHELVAMIEDRFRHADMLLTGLADQAFGPKPIAPH